MSKVKGEHLLQSQGYVFSSYGEIKYLRDVIVTITSLKRFDQVRGIALYCSEEHVQFLHDHNLENYFDTIQILPSENRSITGFKHNTHLFMPFAENLYLDSDMIFCKNPEIMWNQLSVYPYTATGIESADVFFGTHKGIQVLSDIIFRKRQKTLKKFGLTHLYRIQSGIIFAKNFEITKQVNELAKEYVTRMGETHFISRKQEKGRSLDSCEWSLGMAMSHLKRFVYPWFNGYESFQLDFISGYTKHDDLFMNVQCRYYCNPFIYSFRGIQNKWIRTTLIHLFGMLPRSNDHMWVTPYLLHFGWKHEKKIFETYSEKKWQFILKNKS